MPSKTLGLDMKKIKVARTYIFPLLCFLVLLGSVTAMYRMQPERTPHVPARLQFGDTVLRVTDVFDTPEARTQGLSGREMLSTDEAVVFVFAEPSLECFWMKDMNFPIDIIWLDTERRVVHLKQSAEPSSYPDERFCPTKPAAYVIETTAHASGAKIGQQIHFQ